MALLGETIFWSRRRKSLEKLGSVPFGMGPISYFSRNYLRLRHWEDGKSSSEI